MALIRPQEAILFYKNTKIIKQPVLDFGCGDGFFAETVFGKTIIDVGLDLANSRAIEAKKNRVYKKVTYYDGKTIPYPNNYFNTVISNCVLEHIPNLDKALEEIYRVLKPGGIFMTTVMTNEWEKHLFGSKILGKFYVDWLRKIQEHFNLLSEQDWKSKFEKNGFTINKIGGYVSPKNALYLDLFHYLSIPSLFFIKVFHRWTIPSTSSINRWLFLSTIRGQNKTVNIKQASALFFYLQKI